MRTLIVLPDAERVEERLLREVGSGEVARADHLCTWADLVDRLSLGSRRVRLDPISAHAVLGGCARSVELGPFAGIAASPFFVRAAAEVVSALKQGALSPDAFAAAAAQLAPGRRERGLALARLYAAYTHALLERSALDPDDLLLEATRAAEAPGPLPGGLAAFEEVRVAHKHDLTPAEVNLLLALGKRASRGQGPRLVVELPFTHSSGVNVFLEPVFRALEAQGQTLEGLELEPSDPADGEGLGRQLASAIFDPRVPRHVPPPAGLSVVGAPSPEAEAREVARRIRDLVDAGCAPDEVAVVVRTPTQAVERLEEHLERYGVPARTLAATTLQQTPPFQLTRVLYDLLDRDFPREPFAGLLRSRYLRFPEAAEMRAVGRMFREAGVRDDRHAGGYKLRLGKLAERQREAVREDERAQDKASRTEKRTQAVLGAIALIRSLPDEATLATHCRALARLLDKLGMKQTCEAYTDAASAEGRSLAAMARDQEAFGALSELLTVLPAAHEAAGRGAEKLDRERFIAVLADAAGEIVLSPRGQRGGAVRFLDARTMAGREVRHLFVVGLNEGQFPARPEPHPLFPEDDRLRLNGIVGRGVFRSVAPGSDPSPLPSRQSEEPLLFYLSLCAGRESVVLSYGRLDATGRESLRSPFVDELERKFGARIEPAPLAPVPRLEACRAPDELFARTSLEALADPSLRMGAAEAEVHASALVEAVAEPQAARWRSVARRVAMERERLLCLADPEARPGPYSGLAAGVDLSAILNELFAFPKERTLTAKQLDEFGTCPFKSFAVRALKLKPTDEATEDTDSRTRGDVLHRVLQHFYERMRKENRLPLKGLDEERLTLLEVADETLIEVEKQLHVGHPELWRIRKEEALERLQLALQTEQRETAFRGLIPARFEYETKPEPKPGSETEFPPLPLQMPGGGAPVYLGGKIDRVDIGGGQAAVVDYKSASARYLRKKIREKLLHSDFQLVTYLALVQGVLGHEVVDAAFVSLRDHEVVKLSEVLEEKGIDMRRMLKLAPEERQAEVDRQHPNYAHKVVDMVVEMRAGKFPVRPVECTHCHFAGVCRIHAPSVGGDES